MVMPENTAQTSPRNGDRIDGKPLTRRNLRAFPFPLLPFPHTRDPRMLLRSDTVPTGSIRRDTTPHPVHPLPERIVPLGWWMIGEYCV